MGGPQELEPRLMPAKKFVDLPPLERKAISTILQGYMTGTGIVHRTKLGIEGTLETLIGLCDKGFIKINPLGRDRFSIVYYQDHFKGYVEKAIVKIKVER